MLVSCACDWQPTSGNWPCAWRPSDYYRFLPSDSRNRFLSTDLQSAFWKLFGKEPSLGFPMDLTNLHALPNDQKAASRSELTSHQLVFRLLHTRHQHLTDGLGSTGFSIPPHSRYAFSLSFLMAIIAMNQFGLGEAVPESEVNVPYPRTLRRGLIPSGVGDNGFMTQPAFELLQKALALSEEERAELDASLLDSLDTTVDAEAESAWNREIARRIENLYFGKAKTVPWEEVQRR